MPEQEGHVEIVLKFLQKASNYLRTSFPVKVIIAKMLLQTVRIFICVDSESEFVRERQSSNRSETIKRLFGYLQQRN